MCTGSSYFFSHEIGGRGERVTTMKTLKSRSLLHKNSPGVSAMQSAEELENLIYVFIAILKQS
jgi:hypothetical protein